MTELIKELLKLYPVLPKPSSLSFTELEIDLSHAYSINKENHSGFGLMVQSCAACFVPAIFLKKFSYDFSRMRVTEL